MTMQVFGSDKESFVGAAKYIDQNCNCDVIDINMGCPVPKITKNEAGARLLLDSGKVYELVASVVDAVSKPVTVKMRTGWDHNHVYAIENALKIEAAGASAIAVHGRTRSQMYEGKADWSIIKDVKGAVKTIPVIGNGDIDTPETAKMRLDETGVDALMIGRAAMGNPWVLKRIVHYLATGELMDEPNFTEKMTVALAHMDRLINLKGERVALMEMRSHMAWYVKGLPGASNVKREIVQINTKGEMIELLEKYADYLIGEQKRQASANS